MTEYAGVRAGSANKCAFRKDTIRSMTTKITDNKQNNFSVVRELH